MHSTKTLIGWLIILLVIAGGAYAWYYFFSGTSTGLSSALRNDLAQLSRSQAVGNNQAALAQYQQIQANPDASAEAKAIAETYIAGTQFYASGDISSLSQDVERLAAIVANTSLPAQTRAGALSIIGNEYNSTQSDPVFQNAPLQSYVVPGNATLTVINIEEASYALYPSSFAAALVAEDASGEYFGTAGGQNASTSAAAIATAEDYLNKADAAALAEAKVNPAYANNGEYVRYRLLRAETVGHLAIEVGEPYESQYRTAYENFINFMQAGQSSVGINDLLTARYQYARVLALDNDPADEKTQLDLLAQGLQGLANPNANYLVYTFKGAANAKTSLPWHILQGMMSVSPNFRAELEQILASSTASTQ